MAENSGIQWTTHTMNPWRGCTRVSEGCRFCYADTLSGRNPAVLGVWGPKGTRVVASEMQWKEPLKWNKAAAKAGERHRVFCASLADVFEDWSGLMVDSQGRTLESGAWCAELGYGRFDPVSMNQVRDRLGRLITKTPNLDWLLLTKRPQNAAGMMSDHMFGVHEDGSTAVPANVWLGTSVENQAAADERIPHLLATPAAVRFLSCEPLLGPVDLSKDETVFYCNACGGVTRGNDGDCSSCGDCRTRERCYLNYLDWIIVGGESGPGARPMQLEWARSLVKQCQAAGVSCFVKQLGACASDEVNGVAGCDLAVPEEAAPLVSLRLKDRKGGDMAEWPSDLRVRQFPVTPNPSST